MELVYLWVEDYKNIKKQGFNFSPKFHCAYDGETLTIDENKEYIDGFFGDNINVTAIVGKNGSGKSMLLNIITRLFQRGISFDMMIGIFINNELKIFKYNFKNKIVLNNQTNHNITQHEQKIKEGAIYPYSDHFDDYTMIYYANSHLDLLSNLKVVENVHYLGILNEDNDFNGDDYFFKLLPSILYLIKNKFVAIDKLGIILPCEILLIPEDIFALSQKKYIVGGTTYIGVQKVLEKLTYHNEHLGESEKVSNFIEVARSEYSKERHPPTELFLYLQFFISKAFLLLDTEKMKDIDYVIRDKDKSKIVDVIDGVSEGEELLRLLKTFFESTSISNLIAKIWEASNMKSGHDPKERDFLNIAMNFHIELEDFDINLLEEINKYSYNDIFQYHFLDTKGATINYSSGEIAQLVFMSKLARIFKEFSLKENILFIIDEVELYLHPEWQRSYLDKLLKIFHVIMPNKNIDIFLATHSPFILSDLPRENIIFLQDGKQVQGTEKKQTFGANIHTLLSDSFFMEEGLMGEFAKQKINEIINFHKEVEKEDSDIEALKVDYSDKRAKFWNVQKVVGDDYLKQVLENHLVEIDKKLLGQDTAKELKKARLQEELKRLDDD